jgi:catechol 2,3-dioxygenase-like lactoylglutathione lyase family enzyme
MLSQSPIASLLNPLEINPSTSVLSYAYLGLAVTDITRSAEFLSTIGFNKITSGSDTVTVLQNAHGMEVHLFTANADLPVGDKNILMDFPEQKFAGHTHASVMVPSIQAASDHLQANNIPISGERNMEGELVAVFVRDPDRTTFEFETKNGQSTDGKAKQIANSEKTFTSSSFGNGKPIDHVGIRVTNPVDRLEWYAKHLGFVDKIYSYTPNPNPLQNIHPLISRTATGVEVNLLVNGNTQHPENVLTEGGKIKPGIVYVAFAVNDVTQAAKALRTAGIQTAAETDSAVMGIPATCVLPTNDGRSVFLQDPDLNLIRLVTYERR